MGRERARATERGMTLLEVVVAGFVLSIAMLALSASMVLGNRVSDSASSEMVARQTMRGVLAQLEGAPFDQVAVGFHMSGFPVSGLRAATGDTDGLPGEVVFDQSPGDPQNLYRVTLRVRWRGLSGTRTIESVHILANVRADPGTAPSMSEVSQYQRNSLYNTVFPTVASVSQAYSPQDTGSVGEASNPPQGSGP